MSDNFTSALNICNDYYEQKKKIYKKHDIDIDSFNIFESISDKWYREDFHSDILYTILNPDTPQFGHKSFMRKFVAFLELEKEFDCNSIYHVIREAPTGYISWKDKNKKYKRKKGRIDILIKNEKNQAIIIENKINYAPDQENQLVRYMKYVETKLEVNLDNIYVVYLTLLPEDPGPPLDSYDMDFETYTKRLNTCKKISAINSHQKGLIDGFLKECCEILEKNDIFFTYIEQYIKMLDHLAGDACMEDEKLEAIKNIYLQKFTDANEFCKLWNNRATYIYNIIKKDLGKNIDFTQQKVHECSDFFAWPLKQLGCRVYWDGLGELGYASKEGEKFNEEDLKRLFEDAFAKLNNHGIALKTKNNNCEKNTNEHFVIFEIEETKKYIKDIEKALIILLEVK